MAVRKNERINGKHIRHRANLTIQLSIEKETTFLVKSNTPFVSALKKIHKMLDKFDKAVSSSSKYQQGDYKSVKHVVVKGMGKTIEKTLGLGNSLIKDGYKVDVRTGSVEVVDEFEVEDDTLFQKRMVSYVELQIWVKRE